MHSKEEPTPLEMAVDREAKKLTVIPPRKPGEYIVEIHLEDAAGNAPEPERFTLHVIKDRNNALWYTAKSAE